jgi:hypothetical protein
VAANRPFETILETADVGPAQRELVRIETRITQREGATTPVVNVDVHDPFELTLYGWSCNGPGASAAGASGNCKGIVDLIPAP